MLLKVNTKPVRCQLGFEYRFRILKKVMYSIISKFNSNV